MNSFRKIYDYFLSKPRRIVRWGFHISMTGMFILSCGLIGKLLKILTPNAVKGGIKLPPKTLDMLLPYFPTWWIPETWFGYFAAAMIAITGFVIYGIGKRLRALLPE